MQTLAQQRVLIVGGSRGLGLGVMQALMARHANVTVIARDSAGLAALEAQCGVSIIPGDATDPKLAESVLRELRPTVVILNAGATPAMAPIHQQSWESFSRNWQTDVKATFHWIQGALRLPLDRGARVLLSASGAAMDGSPLSGGYAGAKRMIWLMAGYANGVARDLDLGIRFQALRLRQIVGTTELGRAAAEAYARRKGVSIEAFLAGFGSPLSPRAYGEHVTTVLTDPQYESAPALVIRGDTGIQPLDASCRMVCRMRVVVKMKGDVTRNNRPVRSLQGRSGWRTADYRIFNDPGCAGSPYGRRRKVRRPVPGIS